MDRSLTGPDEESKPTPRLGVTLRAERVISRLCRDLGRQVLLLSWPAGAAYLPIEMFQQSDFDVIVGHIERWPIYADARQLRLFCDEQLVIDVKLRSAARTRPLLVLRPADASEVHEVLPVPRGATR